jgi:hypothetical protein
LDCWQFYLLPIVTMGVECALKTSCRQDKDSHYKDNLGFFLFSIDRHDHVFTSMFYIAYAYGKMMKVAALFYLHEVIHVLATCSP